MNRRLLIALALCIILPGCALPWGESESEPPPVLDTIPEAELIPSQRASELVKLAVAPASTLNGLEIQGKLKAEDASENDFNLRCVIQLLMERPAKLRLAATKGLNTEIMDLSMINDSLDVWLPTKNILYRGRVRDLATSGMDFHPNEIVEQLLFPVEEFNTMAWGIVSDTDDFIIVMEVSSNRYKNRLTIDNETGVLIRREIIGPDGLVYLESTFSKHKEIKKHPELNLFPHQVQLWFPQEKRKLLFYRLSIMPNPDTSEKDYRFVAPEDAVIKSLNVQEQVDIASALQEVEETTEEGGQ
ncbi:MAG: hypothetical protein JXA52_03145 [Planctomycetes bacterium]|nr:hypothetical protein [Planctomycetota bacterium]